MHTCSSITCDRILNRHIPLIPVDLCCILLLIIVDESDNIIIVHVVHLFYTRVHE